MLTEEQIKSLKQGDPLIISGIFRRVDKDGDIWVNLDGDYFYLSPSRVSLPSEHGTSVPTPKYDPTRLFRKGDRVRVVECKGRNNSGKETGDIGIVDCNESPGTAEVDVVFEDEDLWEIDPAYLELITPVEELNPYSIDPENSNVLFKYGKKFATFEDDDAAQEVCDRLNAEWRKNQNND